MAAAFLAFQASAPAPHRDTHVVLASEYVKAFSVALADFERIPDLTKRQRQLENYTIDFTRRGDVVYVWLIPNRLPSERSRYGGEFTNGRAMRYKITVGTYRILEREYFK